MLLLVGSTWNDIGLVGQRLPARRQPPGGFCQGADYTTMQKGLLRRFKKKSQRETASPEKEVPSSKYARVMVK